MKNENSHLLGKFGGFAVRHMVESVERRMAEGETVSAAPTDEAEERLLREARRQNRKSRETAENNH